MARHFEVPERVVINEERVDVFAGFAPLLCSDPLQVTHSSFHLNHRKKLNKVSFHLREHQNA